METRAPAPRVLRSSRGAWWVQGSHPAWKNSPQVSCLFCNTAGSVVTSALVVGSEDSMTGQGHQRAGEGRLFRGAHQGSGLTEGNKASQNGAWDWVEDGESYRPREGRKASV